MILRVQWLLGGWAVRGHLGKSICPKNITKIKNTSETFKQNKFSLRKWLEKKERFLILK